MLQQLLTLFGFFSLVLALVFWVNRAVSLLDWLISGGQGGRAFLELTFLSLPTLLANLLPIAAFAATVYTTNKLSAESEMVVVQAAGYSPYRLARPIVVFGLIATLLVTLLSHLLVPLSQRELDLRRAQISSDVTARFLNEGTFVHPADGLTFYVRDITPAGELEDVYLSNTADPESRQSFQASRALIVNEDGVPLLLMFDGMSQVYQKDDKRLAVTKFESFAYSLEGLISAPSTPKQTMRSTTSTNLLSADPAIRDQIGATQNERLAEVASRTNKALQSLTVALVGFAALIVGGFSRFGLWRQVLLAIVLLVVIKSADNSLEGLIGKEPALWPLRFSATFAGIGLAYLLLWKAAHPQIRRRPA